jgi:hypothetical protein
MQGIDSLMETALGSLSMRIFGVLAALLLTAGGPCECQEMSASEIPPGAFIRVREGDGPYRTGALVSAEATKLVWRPGISLDLAQNAQAESIFFSSIEELNVALGRKRSGWNGLLTGVTVFAGLGWLVGKGVYYAGYLDNPHGAEDESMKAMGWGALAGIPVGALLAVWGREEEWGPVRLPSVNFSSRCFPVPPGRLQLGLSFYLF